MGSILFVVVVVVEVYAIFIVGWLLVLKFTAMNKRQIVAILLPTTVPFALLSVFAYQFTGSFMFVSVQVGISSLSAYAIWTLILFGNGQTVGKRLVGIQAVRQSGESVGWGLMFVREVLKLLLHAFLIGFIIDGIMLLSDKTTHQSVADRIAGTMVVLVDR